MKKVIRFLCKLGIHDMRDIYFGPIMFEEKRNHDPLRFKYDWLVEQCSCCGVQQAEVVYPKEEKFDKPFRDASV